MKSIYHNEFHFNELQPQIFNALELLGNNIEYLKYIPKSFYSLSHSIKYQIEFSKSFDQLYNSLKYQTQFSKTFEKQLSIGLKYEHISNFFITENNYRYIEEIKQFSSLYNTVSIDINKKIKNEEILFNNDGTLQIEDKKYEIETVRQNIDESIKSLLSKEEAFEKKMANIFNTIKTKHPVIAFIILTIFLQLFVGIIVNKITSSDSSTNNHNYIINVIQKTPSKMNITKNTLCNLRFVFVESLLVREGCKTKSRIIGELHLGKTVEVINKNRNWTKISWVDEDNKPHIGWAFTRYLKKFK